jgi:hypothetical protein
MSLPHELGFRFRPHLLVLMLVVGAGVALFAPSGLSAGPIGRVVFIAVAIAGSYLVMRVFVTLAVKPLVITLPRIARGWGLAWFYGALPLSLLGFFVGIRVLGAPSPGVGAWGLIVVVASSMAAGAFESIRLTASRLTIGSSDLGGASSVSQGGSR